MSRNPKFEGAACTLHAGEVRHFGTAHFWRRARNPLAGSEKRFAKHSYFARPCYSPCGILRARGPSRIGHGPHPGPAQAAPTIRE